LRHLAKRLNHLDHFERRGVHLLQVVEAAGAD
jgi:hypothetical protein